jgi:hypothetical protein
MEMVELQEVSTICKVKQEGYMGNIATPIFVVVGSQEYEQLVAPHSKVKSTGGCPFCVQ